MYAQGAKVKGPQKAPAISPALLMRGAQTMSGEAYKLARDNQHKPWARRWLRQNGYGFGL